MNTHKFVKPIMQGLTKLHTLPYNKFGGRFLGTFLGNPICMITTVGRKSGSLRTIPLLTIPYKDDYILVASSGGSPAHPAWCYNLINDPNERNNIANQDGSSIIKRNFIRNIPSLNEPWSPSSYNTVNDYFIRTSNSED